MAGDFNPDGFEEFVAATEAAYHRFEINFDSICDKYNRPFPEDDIVSMKTGSIVKDHGSVRKMCPVQFGNAKLTLTKHRVDKLEASSCKQNDMQSVLSCYTTRSHDASHFRDDVSKVFSFIKTYENEPEDAETISSYDSSSSFEDDEQDWVSDLDSVSEDVYSNTERNASKKKVHSIPKQLSEDVWYSLESGSDPYHSGDETHRSFIKLFDKVQSKSGHKLSTEGATEKTDRKTLVAFSRPNIEKFRSIKGETEDSGFESGPAKPFDTKKPIRLLKVDDKLNRVARWVKDQHQEIAVSGMPSPPASMCEFVRDQSCQPSIKEEKSLSSPVKIRRIQEQSTKIMENEPVSHYNTQLVGHFDKTYTLPLSGQQNVASKADMCEGVVQQSHSSNPDMPIEDDSGDFVKEDKSTECLTPRRMVKARKRAMTPVQQPVYTPEQLIDYLTSPKPTVIVDVLSPCRQAVLDGIIPIPAINDLSPFKQPVLPNRRGSNNGPSIPLNNLNKNMTRDSNNTTRSLQERIRKTRNDEALVMEENPSMLNQTSLGCAVEVKQPVVVLEDCGANSCLLGESLSPVHIKSRSQFYGSSPLTPTGTMSKKQIFDHLKLLGSHSDSKVSVVRDHQGDGLVKARRHLALGSSDDQLQRTDPEKLLFNDRREKSRNPRKDGVRHKSRVDLEDEFGGKKNLEHQAKPRFQDFASYEHENEFQTDCDFKDSYYSPEMTSKYESYSSRMAVNTGTEGASFMSPVSSRGFLSSDKGLSPSTGVSQLQLNSPTQAGSSMSRFHRKSGKALFSDRGCSPHKSKTNEVSKHLANDGLNKSTKSSFKPGKSVCDVFKVPEFHPKPHANLKQSGKQFVKCLESHAYPSKYFSDSVSNARNIQFQDSFVLHSVTNSAKESEDFCFAVPGRSASGSLKLIKSSKSKTSRQQTISEKTTASCSFKNDVKLFQNKPVVERQRVWTSTPAKSKAVPILDDTMSTIAFGKADDDEEVLTISPSTYAGDS